MAKKKVRRKVSAKTVVRKKTAKKKTTQATRRTDAKGNGAPKSKLSQRDKKTLDSLVGMADTVVIAARRKRDPAVDIPSRTLSNINFNPRRRILELGKGKTRRELFNLSQAKSYMQTILIGSGCKQLLDQDKTLSIRGLYYMLKHKIKGTNENTFDEQSDSDPIIEDVEVLLGTLREELHLYAKKAGDMVGNIVVVDNGDVIDCSKMGSGGYGVPSIVEPHAIQFKKCSAKFVLHVEKAAVWQRFNEDKFWRTHNCILTHGGGQPPRGVRRMLYRLHNELKLPVYCLLDNDPWGYYIYSVIKQGSINLAYESQRMAIPAAKYIGVRSKDYTRCQLSESVQIQLSDNDRKRARQIADYPWFKKKKHWQREIDLMLKNDFKLEVEALISKDISYVTEHYVPDRLADGDWLD